MDTMARSATGLRFYEDFVPSSEWIREEGAETLIIELPGFRKENLRVQLDNFGNLRTSGERPIDGSRWRRFRKEFHVPDNCNASEIRAKFENGILTVILPKLITQAEPIAPAPAQAPKPQSMDKPKEPEPIIRAEPIAPAPVQAPKPQAMDKPKEPEPIIRAEPIAPAPPQAPDPQTMDKPKEPEPKPQPDLVKAENEKAVSEEAQVREKIEEPVKEKGKLGVGGAMMMKMDRRQLINVAVAAVMVIAVGAYVAYKFRKMAEAEMDDLFDFDEL